MTVILRAIARCVHLHRLPSWKIPCAECGLAVLKESQQPTAV